MYVTLFLATIFHYIFYRDKSQLLKANGYYFKFLRLLRIDIYGHIQHSLRYSLFEYKGY